MQSSFGSRQDEPSLHAFEAPIGSKVSRLVMSSTKYHTPYSATSFKKSEWCTLLGSPGRILRITKLIKFVKKAEALPFIYLCTCFLNKLSLKTPSDTSQLSASARFNVGTFFV